MCDNNGDPFIVTLQNVILAPDQYDKLFSIIMFVNSVHTCLFHKGFELCTLDLKKKFGYITKLCTKATCIFGKNKGNVKDKEITI